MLRRKTYFVLFLYKSSSSEWSSFTYYIVANIYILYKLENRACFIDVSFYTWALCFRVISLQSVRFFLILRSFHAESTAKTIHRASKQVNPFKLGTFITKLSGKCLSATLLFYLCGMILRFFAEFHQNSLLRSLLLVCFSSKSKSCYVSCSRIAIHTFRKATLLLFIQLVNQQFDSYIPLHSVKTP